MIFTYTYHLLNYIRDKNGIIAECILLNKDTGGTEKKSKNDLKKALLEHTIKVDNLTLTKDGKLHMQLKNIYKSDFIGAVSNGCSSIFI